MVPPTTPPPSSSRTGQKSILGRLSLSPSHRRPDSKSPGAADVHPQVPPKNGLRKARTPERYPTHAVAGPSYETMSSQPMSTNKSNEQRAYVADPRASNSVNGQKRAHEIVPQPRNVPHGMCKRFRVARPQLTNSSASISKSLWSREYTDAASYNICESVSLTPT
jgi:hypothetical protein